MTITTHCENCGQDKPETHDGYTACCNELVCDGQYNHNWAIGTITMTKGQPDTYTRTGTKRACCAAKAEAGLPAGTYALERLAQ